MICIRTVGRTDILVIITNMCQNCWANGQVYPRVYRHELIHVHGHAYRHVYGHVYGHVHEHVHGHVYGHPYGHAYGHMRMPELPGIGRTRLPGYHVSLACLAIMPV